MALRQTSLGLSFDILLLVYLTMNWQNAKNYLLRKRQFKSIHKCITEKLLKKSKTTCMYGFILH